MDWRATFLVSNPADVLHRTADPAQRPQTYTGHRMVGNPEHAEQFGSGGSDVAYL